MSPTSPPWSFPNSIYDQHTRRGIWTVSSINICGWTWWYRAIVPQQTTICDWSATFVIFLHNDTCHATIPSIALSRVDILTTNLAACVCVCAKCDPFLPWRSNFIFKRPENFVRIAKFPYAAFGPLFAFHCPIFVTKNNTLNGVCMLNVTAAHWNNICYWGDSAIVSLPHLDRRDTMGLFSSTRQPHTRCALRCTAACRQRGGSGMEGTGVEWSGGEGREGEGRVPDCLGGLSRVGISSRSTGPWNGQPPSVLLYAVYERKVMVIISMHYSVEETASSESQIHRATPTIHDTFIPINNLFNIFPCNRHSVQRRSNETATALNQLRTERSGTTLQLNWLIINGLRLVRVSCAKKLCVLFSQPCP